MPQLLALEECLGTSSGEGGFTMEGIELAAFWLLSPEKRPLFFLVLVGTGIAAKLEGVGLDGPAAAQKGSAMVC